MDLSAADPMTTATELLSGPWYPSLGRSDGHYAFARSYIHPQNQELDGVLLDVSVLPPTPVDPGLPPGHFLRDGEVSPDLSALIIRAYDQVLDADRLWRIPIDGLGQLGAPELLTPDTPEWQRMSFPERSDYSADGSTVVAYAWNSQFDVRMAITIDLVNAAGPFPVGGNFDHEPFSPSHLHLTPDGGELVMYVNQWVHPYSYAYWVDLDGGNSPAQLGEPVDMLHGLHDWAADERTVLWGGTIDYDYYEYLHIIEIGEAQVTEHPVDLQGMSINAPYFHEGGDYVLLRTDTADSLWGVSVVNNQPGPLFAIAGAAAGEDDLTRFSIDASRTLATLQWTHEDLTQDCEIARLADATFVELWGAGPCKNISPPSLRDDDLYFPLTEVDDTARLWHLDITDPFAVPEPISAPGISGGARAISPAGLWVFHAASSKYYLSGLPQPGESDELTFNGMTTTVNPVVIPSP
jgi:hypothetical protein